MLQWMITLVCVSLTVQAQDWDLVWSDEFDGPEIDFTKWSHEIAAGGYGNNEFQVYTPDSANSYIQDGKLFIRPTFLEDNTNPLTGEPFGKDFLTQGVLDLEEMYGSCDVEVEEWNNCVRFGGEIPPIASARLRTAGKFSLRYGRVEIYAKISVGDWMWPALWMLPDRWLYGDWPLSGEIDITEGIGNRDLKCGGKYKGIQHMGSTLHWGADRSENRYYLTNGEFENIDENYGDHFHLYALEWTPNGLKFDIDGEKVLHIPDPLIDDRTSDNCYNGFYEFGGPWNNPNPWSNDLTCDQHMAPYDQDFHLLFNVAVGGTNGFIPDDCVNAGGEPGREKPWKNFISQEEGMWQFYNGRDSWEDTWTSEGDNQAMQVDWVRVYQPPQGFGPTDVPEGCSTDSGPRNCPPEVRP